MIWILLGVWLGCSSPSAPPSPRDPGAEPVVEPLSIGLAIPSYVHAVAWIADDQGYLADAGLDARIQVMGGSAATMTALISGSIDVGLAGGDAVIKADAAGADLVVLAVLVDRFYHRLIGRGGIASVEALRGKRIGLPFLGGPQDLAVRYALSTHGLDASEVEIVSLGKEFNRMAALLRGDIDATTSQTPPGRLAQLGATVLVDLPAEPVSFPYMALVARRDTLTSRRSALQGTLIALCRGIDFYRDHEAESLELLQRHLQGGDTEAAARQRYQTSGPDLLALPPEPRLESLRAVQDFLAKLDDPDLPDTSSVDVAGLIDRSVLLEAQRSGGCLAPR